MATIEENVRALQAKLEEAEKQLFEKKKKERLEKEKSWEYNVDVIKSKMAAVKLDEQRAKRELTRLRAQSSRVVGRNANLMSQYAKTEVYNSLKAFMTSVLECLKRLDERIKAIEETIPPPEV